MEEVATRGAVLVEPALGPSMLAVPAVTLAVVAAANATEAKFIVGIDVPYLSIGLAVGVSESVQYTAVAHYVVAFDNVVQGGFQRFTGLSCGCVIVAVGDLRVHPSHYHNEEEKQDATSKGM